MAIELKMPALSPTMEEGTLAKWLVKEGDDTHINSPETRSYIAYTFFTSPSCGHGEVCVMTRGCQSVPSILCKWIGLFSGWGIAQGS